MGGNLKHEALSGRTLNRGLNPVGGAGKKIEQPDRGC